MITHKNGLKQSLVRIFEWCVVLLGTAVLITLLAVWIYVVFTIPTNIEEKSSEGVCIIEEEYPYYDYSSMPSEGLFREGVMYGKDGEEIVDIPNIIPKSQVFDEGEIPNISVIPFPPTPSWYFPFNSYKKSCGVITAHSVDSPDSFKLMLLGLSLLIFMNGIWRS